METMDTLNNKDKILLAAIELMSEKGYKGVTTKEIAAAAGVNEVTLFRNFGSKMNLLGAAVDRFYYTGTMESIFREQLVWDLRTDLRLISRSYHEIMNRNRRMFMIVLKDDELIDLREKAQRHPQLLKEMLKNYFAAMQERGKLIETSTEAQAMTFLWMNYGAFMTSLHGNASLITSLTMLEFMESSIELFVRALTP
ncbi:TetR/AcrR family transcriptional regulator [Cohnella nanjingensis]|uniref:TetR/AcrR family transcriptional regulator n=1 Tax=Cohnella nanjingensis TaxID=1387779 RepID=A0A7X0RR86_9BACL|nr:TetR/AcrR family transcriptional regulator [Cohnella nanjingensis]